MKPSAPPGRALRDLARLARTSGAPGFLPELWLLGPIEYQLHKTLRKLGLRTGRDIAKVNIYGVEHPAAWSGEVFDGCTDVEIAADWNAIAMLPAPERAMATHAALVAGLQTVLDACGVERHTYLPALRALAADGFCHAVKLATVKQGSGTLALWLEWDGALDLARLVVRGKAAARKAATEQLLGCAWPDFDGIRPQDVAVDERGGITIEVFAGFMQPDRLLKGRPYFDIPGAVRTAVPGRERISLSFTLPQAGPV
ncbi:hypothetical protein PMI14_00342 [Acidovorax sp. CF316]|uniref:hypothetical protein n=1 Tax=Acidovorax sp. CF316 TaxID=1144317 RepID=UPI00026BEBD8|nr:hypothetical protein [Acidovorax sp. CF316]EJE54712.1 hypothetical protein PMI14_00342 [Acidovorax sp. CF316]